MQYVSTALIATLGVPFSIMSDCAEYGSLQCEDIVIRIWHSTAQTSRLVEFTSAENSLLKMSFFKHIGTKASKFQFDICVNNIIGVYPSSYSTLGHSTDGIYVILKRKNKSYRTKA